MTTQILPFNIMYMEPGWISPPFVMWCLIKHRIHLHGLVLS